MQQSFSLFLPILEDELDAGGITEFIASTCWMQGIYIYEELANRSDVVSYFGVTSDFDQDGMLVGHTELCEATPNYAANDACRPLTKTFFLQVLSYKISFIA